MDNTVSANLPLTGWSRGGFIVGGVGLVIAGGWALVSPEQFLQSYLFGFLFWVQLSLGCLGLVMLHHIVPGRWSYVVRRIVEAGALNLLVMAVLVVPILLGVPRLYEWARPEVVAASEVLQHKTPYLNIPFFVGRTVFYFLLWIGLAFLLTSWSYQQDKTKDAGLNKRLRMLSGPGLVFYVLTVTFAAFDWMMSLEPEWFSTAYGVLFIAGQSLATIAFAIIVLNLLRRHATLSPWASVDIFNDLGNLMLGFVCVWAYIAFTQYLIIWSANLPEEVPWYLTRSQNGWQVVVMALMGGHFILPFLILLSRQNKRNVRLLVGVGVFLLLLRWVDLFWLVAPTWRAGLSLHWLDIVATVGVGGVWLAMFSWFLRRQALLPQHDPRFAEVPAEVHH